MQIKVERYKKTKDYTLGKLYINGVLNCYTVEDEIRAVKVKGETAIPEGTYKLALRDSPKFSKTFKVMDKGFTIEQSNSGNSNLPDHKLIWVKDVPGFEYVLIHWGNTDKDTEGCLIVGSSIAIFDGREGVASSKTAYGKIYPIIVKAISSGEEVTITYDNMD
jgi:Family of unknown function (DUF5675)